MEGGAGAARSQQPPPAEPQARRQRPNLTVPQLLALLASHAAIRFGRALCVRSNSTPQPGIAQLKNI